MGKVFSIRKYVTNSTFISASLSGKKRNLKAKVFAKENNFSLYIDINDMDAGKIYPSRRIKYKKEVLLSDIQKMFIHNGIE